MGLLLGYNGKRRAIQASTGAAVAAITTLYVGLLQNAPADMDNMTLASLVSSGQGNEFTVSGTFYTSRMTITVGSITSGASGAAVMNSGADVSWTNSTGSTLEIKGLFITDAASGTTGNVLWVGTPDAGTATLEDGAVATLSAGMLELRVD